jgi:hypothetical protein
LWLVEAGEEVVPQVELVAVAVVLAVIWRVQI